jgi:hypothetical protein
MFHFANAAMLPLLGEMLAKGQGRSSMMFMSACVVTTQLVITLLASWSGRKAGSWGRKPLLLVAFGALPVRAVLYTLTDNTARWSRSRSWMVWRREYSAWSRSS